MEVQEKPKKQGKRLKKRKRVAGNSTPPPDSEVTAEPKLVPAVEEHLEDDPYHVNSDMDFEDNVTDGNKEQQVRKMEEVKEVKASMEANHGNQEEEGEDKDKQKEGKRTHTHTTSGTSTCTTTRPHLSQEMSLL